MKRLIRTLSGVLCVLLLMTIILGPVSAEGTADFSDVSEHDWFYEDVCFVAENGILKGTGATTFSPEAEITRAMAVTALHRLAGTPRAEGKAPFEDVAATDYFYDAVLWAKDAGIINGDSATTFSPQLSVTREQFACMLYNYTTEYLGIGATGSKDLTEYTDANTISDYAADAMRWVCGNEILRGNTATTLAPQDTATRAEIAALLHRFMSFLDRTHRDGLRIVCMAPSMVECVYALGYGDCIVGWFAYTDYPVAATETGGYQPYQFYYNTDTQDFDVDYELGRKPGADGEYKEVATVSKFYDYNQAILDGLQPTLVLCEGSEQEPWVETLTAQGYPTYCWTPESIDEIYDMMIEIGALLGAEDYARELVAGYYQRIDEITSVTKDLVQIRTYFEIAHQSDYGEWGKFGPYTEGGNTPFDEMIKIAGGENLFHDGEGYMNLYAIYGEDAFAEIVKRNPQVIMTPYWPGAYDFEVTSLYEIMTRPGFNETEAVQTGRVTYYDSSLMKRFGPRTITAIEKLAYLLHPYYFENPQNSVSPWELGKIDVAEPAPAPLP